MRKIIESTLVSLDGVVADPHTWAMENFDHEAEQCALELLSEADAMLMGRRTYEFFAVAFPHQTGEYGWRINSIRKYVFSNTLAKADWSNSTIVRGDVVTEAAKLKEKEGGSLVIYGHGLLTQTLLHHDLLDELKIWVYPLLVGRGQLLFREGNTATLKLETTRTLGSGTVVLTYRPTRANISYQRIPPSASSTTATS
jgi:dihydrofolate reductase